MEDRKRGKPSVWIFTKYSGEQELTKKTYRANLFTGVQRKQSGVVLAGPCDPKQEWFGGH
jgi:hypothetical protein